MRAVSCTPDTVSKVCHVAAAFVVVCWRDVVLMTRRGIPPGKLTESSYIAQHAFMPNFSSARACNLL
jgi:hypothetical protein